MDIQMPIMNGYEAATAIRAAAIDRPDLAQIPIIALSADAFAEDVRHSHSAGMNDHMAKPMEISKIQALQVIETRKPRGLFFVVGQVVTGIDNRTGDAWTEDFTTKRECLKWLKDYSREGDA